MPAWRIDEGGLDDPRVVALVEHHAATARAATRCAGHSFSADRLRAPDITVFTAWADDQPIGVGALKALSATEGEVKSMHTATAARGQGVGAAILDRITDAARAARMTRLSLETHPGDHFAAAIALYRRAGFAECGPFADYTLDPASLYMTKEL